jgi:uncharacterized protein YuzE
MNFTYDKKADAGYVTIIPKSEVMEAIETIPMGEGVLLDREMHSKKIVGVEILFLKQKMGLSPKSAAEEFFG